MDKTAGYFIFSSDGGLRMKRHMIKLVLAIAALASFGGYALAQWPLATLDGACAETAYISEGPIGSDLTKRRARFQCDSLIISVHAERETVMFHFAQKDSSPPRPVAFAGRFEEDDLLAVERVYLTPGEASVPNDGFCKLFYAEEGPRRPEKLKCVVCGAQIDRAGRRTVPNISFHVRAEQAIRACSS